GKSDETSVFLVDKNGAVRETKYAGFMVPSWKKDFSFGNQYEDRVLISLQESDTATLYVKFKPLRNRPPWINLSLTQRDFYHYWSEVERIQKNWLFIGFLLTFFFISLILYIVTRDKVFLYHALFQLGVFIYLLEFFSILVDLP
ncbi:hypothetical protein RZS08_15065, partial [Arthrospira platensis SPKY1]|nr:hypothetical protein [Arthrospira platensis SPKY1]